MPWIALPICLIISFAITANAQKLPTKQEVSIYAPATIKIDGKATEWDNSFRAYNNATDIFYTLSNDDNNLYLTIQVTNPVIVNKVISGGITFAISSQGKKNKDAVSITYPVFDKKSKPVLIVADKAKLEQQAANREILPDSIVALNNRSFAERSKMIMVTGIKGMDTLISVYNEDHIKVASAFDNRMAYTYELAISLKNLGIDANGTNKFAYHIILNGDSPLTAKRATAPGGASAATTDEISNAKLNAELNQLGRLTAPTDFWAEYTLAKK